MVAAVVAAPFFGATELEPVDLLDLSGQSTGGLILWHLRVPRVVAAFFAGLGLALGASQMFVNRLQRRLDEASGQVSAMAITDELTGLPNRQDFLGRAATALMRAQTSDTRMAVVMVDVDSASGSLHEPSIHEASPQTPRVSNEHIETLLRAGMAAPSAGNQQAWEFVVIDDKQSDHSSPSGLALPVKFCQVERGFPS